MPSSGWESTDLLALFNTYSGRPTTDAITDAQKYARLARAQNRVIALMSAVCPNSLYPHVAYGSIPTLTTTDNQVYTFGTDDEGYAKFPMGKGGIFQSLNDIPTSPLRPGQDYMIEGNQIRALNNGTLPATLYWYGIGQPADIDASTQPALTPEASRELIVVDAVRQFAKEYVRNMALADAMEDEWSGSNGRPGLWPTWCLVWKTQFRHGGALNYTGMQLAIGGQWGWYGQMTWGT